MPSGSDYRALAAECFALAQKTSDPNDRARLIAMAQAWQELAERSKSRPDNLPAEPEKKP